MKKIRIMLIACIALFGTVCFNSCKDDEEMLEWTYELVSAGTNADVQLNMTNVTVTTGPDAMTIVFKCVNEDDLELEYGSYKGNAIETEIGSFNLVGKTLTCRLPLLSGSFEDQSVSFIIKDKDEEKEVLTTFNFIRKDR